VHLLDVLVDAGLVRSALDEGGLDLALLDPLLDVLHEEVGYLVGIPVEEELGQVVIGVDPGARDHLQAGLLGDAAHELDIAAEEHRGGFADRLDAELHRGLRLTHGDVEDLIRRDLVWLVLLDRPGGRPLVADGLVAVPQVLVDQRRPQLVGVDRPGHRLHLRHGARNPMRSGRPGRLGYSRAPLRGRRDAKARRGGGAGPRRYAWRGATEPGSCHW
jgi:hypothetical protein